MAYRQTNLASSVPGAANNVAPSVVVPWGIAVLPGQPLLVAENGSGMISLHNASGTQSGTIGVPVPAADASHATPIAIVSDASGLFGPAVSPVQYVITAEDGTISALPALGNNVPASAKLVRDDSTSGAVYTGLALLFPGCCAPYVGAADFHAGTIDTFTSQFDLLAGLGPFTDPALPPGYAPFGMQVIGTRLFITYAVQDAEKRSPVFGAGNGLVDEFDTAGNFLGRLATGGTLNAPWGVAQAGPNFGPFSNAILVANAGDGTISAFDSVNNNFLGQLEDGEGNVLTNPGIHGLAFVPASGPDPDTLFFTAGAGNVGNGVLGAITVGLTSMTNVSAAPVPAHTPSAITVTVLAGPGNTGTPTGTVTILEGGAVLSSAALSAGAATFNVPLNGVGTHAIEAQYGGDAAFLGSESVTEARVTGPSTTLTLSAPATAVHGAPVTLTATIASTGGMPTGNVAFLDGSATVGSAPLSAAGVATFTVSTLSVGAHTFTATYTGDGSFGASVSPASTVDVSGTPGFTLSASPASVTLTAGQAAPVMLTVTPSGGFTGTVSFSCASVPGITCTFNPTAVTPTASGAAVSTGMSINTTTSVGRYGLLPGGMVGPRGLAGTLAVFALAALALTFLAVPRFASARTPVLVSVAAFTVFALSLALGGCGYGSNYTAPQNAPPATVTVTAVSGSLTQTAMVSVTVQ